MTGPTEFAKEEPWQANPYLHALDEEKQRLVLAEFPVDSVSRYSFIWPIGDPSFPPESVALIEELTSRELPVPHFVLGWQHTSTGTRKYRHQLLVAHLSRTGWDVHAEKDLGIAVKPLADTNLLDTVRLAEERHAGWFIAFGRWASARNLAKAPFRKTMTFFCRDGRLPPSRQFAEGIAQSRGAVAYAVSNDMVHPRIVLITPSKMGEALADLLNQVA